MLQKKLYAKSFFILLQKFFFEKLLAKRILVNPILSSIKTWFLSTPPGGGYFSCSGARKFLKGGIYPPQRGGGVVKKIGVYLEGYFWGFLGFFGVFKKNPKRPHPGGVQKLFKEKFLNPIRGIPGHTPRRYDRGIIFWVPKNLQQQHTRIATRFN